MLIDVTKSERNLKQHNCIFYDDRFKYANSQLQFHAETAENCNFDMIF